MGVTRTGTFAEGSEDAMMNALAGNTRVRRGSDL
jgi:hypothetical protein